MRDENFDVGIVNGRVIDPETNLDAGSPILGLVEEELGFPQGEILRVGHRRSPVALSRESRSRRARRPRPGSLRRAASRPGAGGCDRAGGPDCR